MPCSLVGNTARVNDIMCIRFLYACVNTHVFTNDSVSADDLLMKSMHFRVSEWVKD